jgi:hypothetical protein
VRFVPKTEKFPENALAQMEPITLKEKLLVQIVILHAQLVMEMNVSLVLKDTIYMKETVLLHAQMVIMLKTLPRLVNLVQQLVTLVLVLSIPTVLLAQPELTYTKENVQQLAQMVTSHLIFPENVNLVTTVKHVGEKTVITVILVKIQNISILMNVLHHAQKDFMLKFKMMAIEFVLLVLHLVLLVPQVELMDVHLVKNQNT